MSNRKKIVAGNWKMNLSLKEAKSLVNEVTATSKTPNVIKIFFPSFLFIPQLSSLIKENNFFIGAQNCNQHEAGAYTGEVSAKMLKEFGCTYVLIGHSERRLYCNETNEQLVQKIKLALENNLQPVFCVGEVLADRKSNKHFDTVGIQLHEVLKNFSEVEVKNVSIAYEPVWAIGTGETATPKQAQEMHAFIRRTIKEMFGIEIALNISILYGGSCNPKNAKELFACPDVDGGLIGGASLKAKEFCQIIDSF
jgi:triosephosphate isomerase